MEPVAGVNYDIIFNLQLVGLCACIFLLGLQFGAHYDAVKGWWIVFAPFAPTLLWTRAVRQNWHAAKAANAAAVKAAKVD